MSTDEKNQQQPIGTGFTASSTVDDVLEGIDLTGKRAVITGGHVGLGLEMTRALSKAGASVTVAARRPESADAVRDIERVEVDRLDLVDPASVSAFADRYLATGRPIDILINNAGIMAGPLARDARGYESNFATNHLGHFQLTLALLPALRAAGSARVVNMTSGAHRLSGIRWDDPHFADADDYDGHLAYAQSKTANVLFAVELDRRWSVHGIRGYAVHPGIIAETNLGPARSAGEDPVIPPEEQAMHRDQGLIDESGEAVIAPELGLKTPKQGASTAVLAATSPLLSGVGGVYLKDNDVSPIDDSPALTEFDGPPPAEVAPHAIDPDSARRLWDLSERLLAETGLPQ
jgi:NAD(P)-dependent dehydrogenase (short-subunit alcohol dehydrogenase family)